jgi:hypothetical protein
MQESSIIISAANYLTKTFHINNENLRCKGFNEAMRCTDGGEHCVFRRERAR